MTRRRKRTSAKQWADQMEAEQRRRNAKASVNQVASRKRNAVRRAHLPPMPDGWEAAFYVPRRLRLKDLPADERWPAGYFLNSIHWRTVTWRSDARGFA